jgi:elongation factor Ts
MKVSVEKIKELREKTGAPIMRVKNVLEETKGDVSKAEGVLKKEGFKKVQDKAKRETSQGLVYAYIHHSGKVGSMVELLCETDFVAKNEVFKELAHNIALQIASMEPRNVKSLEKQEYIKDPSKKVVDLVKEAIVKTGENIKISRFNRLELGK